MDTPAPSPLRLELLYFDGCPSYRRLWNDLLEVVAEHHLDVTVRPVAVTDADRAEALGFLGSPSLRLEGEDLEGRRGAGVLACRRYPENGGRGWPSRQLLERALLRAAGRT